MPDPAFNVFMSTEKPKDSVVIMFRQGGINSYVELTAGNAKLLGSKLNKLSSEILGRKKASKKEKSNA